MKRILGIAVFFVVTCGTLFADVEKGITTKYFTDTYDNVKFKSIAYHTSRSINSPSYIFSGNGDGFIDVRGYTGVIGIVITDYVGTTTVRVEGLAGTTTTGSAINIVDSVLTANGTDYIYVVEEGLWESIKVSVKGTSTVSVIGNFSRRFK